MWLLASNMWLLASNMWLLAANMWLLASNMWLLTQPGIVLKQLFLKSLIIVLFNSNTTITKTTTTTFDTFNNNIQQTSKQILRMRASRLLCYRFTKKMFGTIINYGGEEMAVVK